MDYEECRLTIKKDDKGQSVVDYVDSFFSSGQGMLQLDPLTKETIHRFMHWVAKYEDSCSKEDLQVLGLHLYQVLFDENLRKIFDNAYEKFTRKRQSNKELTFRLKLTFTKDFMGLAQYPWEFLFMPASPESTSGEFLAKSTELILTRFLPDQNIDKLFNGESPVRILIVSSHPRRSDGKALDKIETEEFWDEMEQDEGRLVIKHLENPSLEELRETIQGTDENDENGEAPKPAFHPHIFHFIGHGKPGRIALTKDPYELEARALREGLDLRDMDDAEWINGQELSDLFQDNKPGFIFLNACEGGRSEVNEVNISDIQNLAHDLVNTGIPAVVAMQYEIKNQDANSFAHMVYQQIHEGEPIDKAIKRGIMELGKKPSPSWNHRRFGTPVFYLQAKDTTLLPKLKSEDKSSALQQEAVWEDCPHCNKTRVKSSFVACPGCKGPLRACPNPRCNKPISPYYTICPYCSYDLEENEEDIREQPDQQEASAHKGSNLRASRDSKKGGMMDFGSSVATKRSVND